MADTLHRAYPRPDTSRTIAEEFPVSDQALVAIDADIHALFQAILGLAPAAHTHELADINGLVAALAGKAPSTHAHALDDLTDVSGAAGAADGYVLVKTGAGWIPGSPASVIGSHEHAIGDVVNLQTALDGKLSASSFTGATVKATPADADVLGFFEVTGSVIKKLTFTNLQEWVRTKLGAMISASTAKATPVDGDQFLLADSQAGNAPTKHSWLNLKAGLKAYFDTLYQPTHALLTALSGLVNAAGALKNDGSGNLSWGSAGASRMREVVFTSSGNFTPNADAVGYQIVAVGVGGAGQAGSDNQQGKGGSAAGGVIAAGTKAEIGNAVIPVTIGAAGTGNTNAGTPTSFGNLVTANSGRNAVTGTHPGGNGVSNLSEKQLFSGGTSPANGSSASALVMPPYTVWGDEGDPDTNSSRPPYGQGGRGGNTSGTNNNSNQTQLSSRGIVIVREFF